MEQIVVKRLSKQVKYKTVLSDISFTIKQGECVALIGQNGAGKTTLLSCLLGNKSISQGDISLLGHAPNDLSLKQKLGVLFQENIVPDKLRVNELLDFFQSIYKAPLSEVEIDNLLQFTPEQKKQFASDLSGGQKRLLSFVISLIGRPKLLLLDEPTAAMDTSTRRRFWEIIQELKEQKVTIIYSSHYIEEVEHTADRILVLHQGKLLKDTTPFQMRYEDREKQFTLPLQYAQHVKNLGDIYDYMEVSDTLQFKTKQANTVWQYLVEKGCTIEEVEIINKTLLNTLFDQTKEEQSC